MISAHRKYKDSSPSNQIRLFAYISCKACQIYVVGTREQNQLTLDPQDANNRKESKISNISQGIPDFES